MAAKQTYIWSTPFFDFEFVDIRTKRSKGEIVKGRKRNQRHSQLFSCLMEGFGVGARRYLPCPVTLAAKLAGAIGRRSVW